MKDRLKYNFIMPFCFLQTDKMWHFLMSFPNIGMPVELYSYATERHTLALNQQWYPAQHKYAT